jgi:hypothetical protein
LSHLTQGMRTRDTNICPVSRYCGYYVYYPLCGLFGPTDSFVCNIYSDDFVADDGDSSPVYSGATVVTDDGRSHRIKTNGQGAFWGQVRTLTEFVVRESRIY